MNGKELRTSLFAAAIDSIYALDTLQEQVETAISKIKKEIDIASETKLKKLNEPGAISYYTGVIVGLTEALYIISNNTGIK